MYIHKTIHKCYTSKQKVEYRAGICKKEAEYMVQYYTTHNSQATTQALYCCLKCQNLPLFQTQVRMCG